jgi:hypothetical protein
MSWKKYFRVTPENHRPALMSGSTNEGSDGTSAHTKSYLPEVYTGHPNRIQRYYQYDDMDRDSDITIALNTIADFCTQSEEHSDNPFELKYSDQANETEIKLLKNCLIKWTKLNDFKQRLWFIFRNTIKNGDVFFLRDPETNEWLWLDHFNVMMVKVNEENGKEPEEYIVKGLDYNKGAKYATKKTDMSSISGTPYGPATMYSSRGVVNANPNFSLAGAGFDPRAAKSSMNKNNEVHAIDAEYVVHLSLSTGMDINWPFGQSILESIFKTYMQKQMLEDAIIIYRIQRAPERRVFYIDTGDMPPARAKLHLQAIKNEIHQRRIPSRTANGGSAMDAAYNPLSLMDDFFFSVGSEGRGSKVETLPGGDSLGEIGDLDFFNKKLARGLQIPTSYLAMSDEQSGVQYNDGKLGAAMIQEFRFNKYCTRIQNQLSPVFEKEFKRFVKENGINIDGSIYELMFNPPQNFTKYRQIEIDQAQVAVYQQVSDNKKLSERFKLKRFLNLTEEEVIENERMWKEENAAKMKKVTGSSDAETNSDASLASVGIRPGIDSGLDMPPPEEGGGGEEGMPPADGAAPALPPGGGAPPATGGSGSPPPPPPGGGF